MEIVSRELTSGRNPLIEARATLTEFEPFLGKSRVIARFHGIVQALLMEIDRRDNALENQDANGIMPVQNPPNPALTKFKAFQEGQKGTISAKLALSTK